jgi:hypothetical protein
MKQERQSGHCTWLEEAEGCKNGDISGVYRICKKSCCKRRKDTKEGIEVFGVSSLTAGRSRMSICGRCATVEGWERAREMQSRHSYRRGGDGKASERLWGLGPADDGQASTNNVGAA